MTGLLAYCEAVTGDRLGTSPRFGIPQENRVAK